MDKNYGLNKLEDFSLVVVKGIKKMKVVKVLKGKAVSMAQLWLMQNSGSCTFADLFNSKNEWLGRFMKRKDSFIFDFVEADEYLTLKDLYEPA